MTNSTQLHWDNVYATKGEADVSWFQQIPTLLLDLLALAGAHPNSAIIDVGGGASRLVDALVAKGFSDVSVLDLSREALNVASARLGDAGQGVKWIVADATEWTPSQSYDIWHDRAAFHFLNEAQQQSAYVARVMQSLRVGGHIIIGTFASDGPERCSGLPVTRHSSESLQDILGPGFVLLDNRLHEHVTPWDSKQSFQFSTFRRIL
jgi:ubiquinone/menaquinone biosynthesis C-methylase UbiE